MKTAVIAAFVAWTAASGAALEKEPRQPAQAAAVFESSLPATPQGAIDRAVFAKLESLGIRPALCSDAVFVRRAYLDVIGSLPTADEVREFLQDTDTKGKRRRLIDRLLEREEYADYWAMKWGDILRIKAEFPVNLWPNAAQAYHRWIRASIAENKPYDQFVREMLTSSGSNFRVGPVNFYRAVQNRTPEGIAGAVALTFMGARVEAWPKERVEGLSAFFSQVGYKPTREWKEEDVFWDPLDTAAVTAVIASGSSTVGAPPPAAPATEPIKPKAIAAAFPDGTSVKLSPNRDPRETFANWLITPQNPWFTRSVVNRVWAWLLGRGIIHEPDDLRDDNPASNPALLAHLEKEMIASRYDMKRLYRLILNSSVYQFASTPCNGGEQAEKQFARYPLRRLEAEVLIDAVNKITGASDLYTSAIPEPFTYIPKDKPAVALPDGSITSHFLTLFGRSARATGLENERINKPVPAQWLHMLNSSHVQRKLAEGPKMRDLLDARRRPEETIRELYLTILSRPPTPAEVEAADAYGGFSAQLKAMMKPAGKGQRMNKAAANAMWQKRRDDWIDIAWSLINSTEFLYRH